MNDNTYQVPPEPSVEPIPPSTSPFGEFTPPTVPVEPSLPPKNSLKKKLLVALAIGIVLVGGLTGTVLSVSYFSRPLCLTALEYRSLTGSSPDKLSAVDNFYTYTVHYDKNRKDYSKDSADATNNFIKKIGIIAKNNPDKSIVVTVSSDYQSDNDSSDTAADRIYNLSQALQKAGIPEKSIDFQTPDNIEPEDSDEALIAPIATIAITSTKDCR